MHRALSLAVTLLLIVFSGVVGCRSAPKPPAATAAPGLDALETAKGDFYLAVDGDARALDRALSYFEGAHGRRPEWALASAYLGAAKLLAAREAFLPWEKGKLSKEGLALLDAAVEAGPADMEVRFVRGMTTRRLPGFMKRGETAERDLAIVASDAEKVVEEGRLHPRLGAAALYQHGVVLHERGDRAAAAGVWERAVRLAPDAPGGRAAAAELGLDES